MSLLHLKNKQEKHHITPVANIAIIFAIAFCFLISHTYPVFAAEANHFEVQNVELETSDGDIVDFDEGSITSSATLRKPNDTAKYTITLHNTDDQAHVIENITDDNTNSFLTYEYDKHIGEKIDPNTDFVFVVTAKYITYIPDTDDLTRTNSVKFQIHFTDYVEEIDIIPNTGDNILVDVIIFTVALAGLVTVIILARRKKLNKYTSVATIAAIALTATVATVVKAQAVEISDFTLTTDFTLGLGRVIHYDGNYPDDGQMTDSHWTSTGTLKPNAFVVYGYHFTGWSLIMDHDVVYSDEEPMVNIPDEDSPLTLYAYWDPNVYTINFHANAEGAQSSMRSITAEFDDYRASLPRNEFILEGYRFIGWKKDNEGSLISDGGPAGQFRDAEHGGTVDLYAQWEVAPIGIDYYRNSSEATGVTLRQDRTSSRMALYSPNYKYDGYGFAGWNTKSDGTGTMYGPNETVTVPSDTSLKLYAAWIKAEEGVDMQSFDDTAEPYASYPVGKVIALTDNRDNETYAVAKLPDSKWWMTENLRLAPTSDIEFTANNTNNPSSILQTTPITNTLCTDNTADCINRFAFNTSNIHTLTTTSSIFAYRSGVYYNVFSATAGHAAVDEDNLVTERVAGDICPSGWHLPISGENGDFRTLDVSLGGNGRNTINDLNHVQKYFKAPINLIAAGWAYNSSFRNINSDAVYLETDTNGKSHRISIFYDSTASIESETIEKYNALTIRCIAE